MTCQDLANPHRMGSGWCAWALGRPLQVNDRRRSSGCKIHQPPCVSLGSCAVNHVSVLGIKAAPSIDRINELESYW